ncbi:neprosin family prolyl endopeptidase [Actinoplanes subglobosus]|uniref:Neprosin family prolyl endopeptidase n=1 Tax=Actinoplanes subglobosus TaxID=1547892 RepID=A0ABV8ILP4_9ACTN
MSNSRRGAFAAALVAAVVGSIGLASTLNAGAEEVPAPPPVTESATPEAEPEPELVPPPRLPWGQTPNSLEVGADGASSQVLKAEGLDAAAPGPDGEPATEEYAPKGRSSRSGVLRSAPTEVVPPKPPAAGTAAAQALATQTVYFHYNVGSQSAVTDGAYANFSINKPTLATADYHTLAEVAVQSADGTQIVEVGWNVDRVVNGDSDPHLFVYHWINGQSQCYNGCGFVQYSSNVSPGDTLPQDTTKRMGVQYYSGAWWIAYDTEWVGYFPGSRWSNNFTQSGMVQVFGEVAAASNSPCSAMGNGLHGASDSGSARIGSVSFINGPAVDLYVRSLSNHYDVAKLSGRTFRYGGPGAC